MLLLTRFNLVFAIAALGLATNTTGCVSPAAIRSTVRWNLVPDSVSSSNCDIDRGLALASKTNKELEQIMNCKSPPCPTDLIGKWYGINKGAGIAAMGFHQDVKVFHSCDNRIEGYNILVEQVAIDELSCRGWLPKRGLLSDEPKKMGNFVVTSERDCCKNKLILDYSLGDNPALDPSQYLADELVQVAPGLLLGRARVRIGMVDKQVAYFVLMRLDRNCDCDREDSASSCDGCVE